jgi:hypothetical protein
MEDSIEESGRGRFVSLGFTSAMVGGLDVEWIT